VGGRGGCLRGGGRGCRVGVLARRLFGILRGRAGGKERLRRAEYRFLEAGKTLLKIKGKVV